jgi:hypothetical protein
VEVLKLSSPILQKLKSTGAWSARRGSGSLGLENKRRSVLYLWLSWCGSVLCSSLASLSPHFPVFSAGFGRIALSAPIALCKPVLQFRQRIKYGFVWCCLIAACTPTSLWFTSDPALIVFSSDSNTTFPREPVPPTPGVLCRMRCYLAYSPPFNCLMQGGATIPVAKFHVNVCTCNHR